MRGTARQSTGQGGGGQQSEMHETSGGRCACVGSRQHCDRANAVSREQGRLPYHISDEVCHLLPPEL